MGMSLLRDEVEGKNRFQAFFRSNHKKKPGGERSFFLQFGFVFYSTFVLLMLLENILYSPIVLAWIRNLYQMI